MQTARDEVDRRRAFVGLLANPVVDRQRDRDLFALINHRAHRTELMNWFGTRLGYRLVITETAARLFRLPLGNNVTAPRRIATPPRRLLVLALLAAAAAEDAEDITTTQDLSDRVRVLSARNDAEVAAYEPDRFAERKIFAAAVDLLITTGVLLPIGSGGDVGERWARRNDKIGRTYQVQREMLLRMLDPASIAAALGERGPAVHESGERFAVMRRLIELPVCLYSDLTAAEHTYLIHQRGRLLAWCTEMTGWSAEQRAEGIALIASDETGTDLAFPRLRAVDFAALMVLGDLYGRRDPTGVVTEADLMVAVTEVAVRQPKSITAEIGTEGARRERTLELLRALDLLRPGPGPDTWQIMPAAARYRDPRVVSVTARIDEEIDD